jgi:hypothetical protein
VTRCIDSPPPPGRSRDASLYGLAVWESEDAAHAAGPALNAAVADDDFESWLAGMDHHTLTEV